MLTEARSRSDPLVRRLLGQDEPRDLALVLALFAIYVIVDSATRITARVSSERLDEPILLLGAIASQPLAFAAIGFAAVIAAWRFWDRLWVPWSRLEQGNTIRALAVVPIALLAWRGSLYEFNFVLGQTHAVDRLLLVGLAVGCAFRPLFLVPFALQTRVIGAQFDFPFGASSAQHSADLLVIVVLVIGAAHLLFVVARYERTAALALLIGAAIASHFYIPGTSKLSIDWLSTTDFFNMSLSSYTAGWRGQGDGSWSRWVSDLTRTIGTPALVATLAFELSAGVAILHHRLLRLWLPLCVVFHVSVFVTAGFWFLQWIALEVAFLVFLTRPNLQSWLRQNATPARAVIGFCAVVVLGSTIFHPPALAWFDAPVSHGYRIEATGVSGTQYNVPISAFAPLEQDVAFFSARLAPTNPVSGAYGALFSKTDYERLQAVESFADVAILQSPAPTELRQTGQLFMRKWMDNANNGRKGAWEKFAPPNWFWTGSASPTFSFDEQIDQLDVFLLTAIHHDGKPEFRRELVLTLKADETGKSTTTFPESLPAG